MRPHLDFPFSIAPARSARSTPGSLALKHTLSTPNNEIIINNNAEIQKELATKDLTSEEYRRSFTLRTSHLTLRSRESRVSVFVEAVLARGMLDIVEGK